MPRLFTRHAAPAEIEREFQRIWTDLDAATRTSAKLQRQVDELAGRREVTDTPAPVDSPDYVTGFLLMGG